MVDEMTQPTGTKDTTLRPLCSKDVSHHAHRQTLGSHFPLKGYIATATPLRLDHCIPNPTFFSPECASTHAPPRTLTSGNASSSTLMIPRARSSFPAGAIWARVSTISHELGRTYHLESYGQALHLGRVVDSVHLLFNEPTAFGELAIRIPFVPDLAFAIITFRGRRRSQVRVLGSVDARDGETSDGKVQDVVHCCRDGHEREFLGAVVRECRCCLDGTARRH